MNDLKKIRAKKPKRNVWKDALYGTFEGPRGEPKEWSEIFNEVWDAATGAKILAGEGPLEILGLKAGATMAEIKTAFRALAKKHHPDHGGDPEMFKKVYAAYETLKEMNK